MAHDVLGVFAGRGVLGVGDAIEEDEAREARAALVGDIGRRLDRTIGALGLRQHREQRRRLGVDRYGVLRTVVDPVTNPAAVACEGKGAIALSVLDEEPEDPARHQLA
jgi:hypothetical protein